jgi:hypothetical protein
LEKALRICRERDYVTEMVFLLGRMGNNKQALMLIIERLGDVQRVSIMHGTKLTSGYRFRQRASRRRPLGGSTSILRDST